MLLANLIINRQERIQALHFTVIVVRVIIWSIFSNLCRLSVTIKGRTLREFSKSGLSRSATVSNSKKKKNNFCLAAGSVFQQWIAKLTKASSQKLKIVQTRGEHGWSLTLGGTLASGPDARAALEMQNLNSGIFPRSLTTSVDDIAEKKLVYNWMQFKNTINISGLLYWN